MWLGMEDKLVMSCAQEHVKQEISFHQNKAGECMLHQSTAD